jgi:hypothetical protein
MEAPTIATSNPSICEEKARLESSCKNAEEALDTARSAIRQKVGKSSRDEYLTLDSAVDIAWDRLQHARTELATHIREHGCGVVQEAPPRPKPIW